MNRVVCWGMAALFVMGFACRGMAQGLPEPDPAQIREGAQRRGDLQNFNGEASAWHAAYVASDFLLGYEAYGNVKWLEEGEKFYDFLISKLTKDPDGYEGWIGETINQTEKVRADALVGDAIMCEFLVEFALIVRGKPELQARFGAKADEYVKLVRRIIWDKWNHRGCYYEDAGYGGYHTHDKVIDGATGKWLDRPSSVISDNLNKHYSAGRVILRLWRLDPRPEYKERVIKIFSRAKAMWRHFPDEDRIVWNFWMPQGPYDLEGTAPKSWVGVHSSRAGYQAGEVGDWIEVYDSGLVFEQKDFERIIRTNHWMADNGWKCADGTSAAGTRWDALARFDDRIRKQYEEELRGKNHPRFQIRFAYLKNVTEKQLGWKRRHVKDESQVQVSRPPLCPGRFLTMAIAIPSVVETANAARIKFATQTRQAGTLKLELLAQNGKDVLGEIWSGPAGDKSEYHAPAWDGSNPQTGKKDLGSYWVRWTLNDEQRLWPVAVVVGEKREKTTPDAMRPGEVAKEDFEGTLSQRWLLEGAEVSSEQVRGGGKSLKLINGTKAEFLIGEHEALPVKVSFWIFDNGKNFGKDTANGAKWGVKTAAGDKFVLAQCWRKYLNGDNDYVWFNSGENQFFNPHPARIGRASGWTQCVFDFTNPAQATVTCNGKPVGTLNAKFTPKGAVAIWLVGGDPKTGPLYIDDLEVEYPQR